MASIDSLNVQIGAQLDNAGFAKAEQAITGIGVTSEQTARQAQAAFAGIGGAAATATGRYIDANGKMRDANGKFVSSALQAAEAAAKAGGAAASAANGFGTLAGKAAGAGTALGGFAGTVNSQLTASFAAADASRDSFEKGFGRLGDTLKGVGEGLTKYVSLPLAALGYLATTSAIEFESAFAGVKKTLDTSGLSAAQTQQAYAGLSQGIRDLAKEIPATTTAISGVAEAAGQLGIKRDNVLAFTKVMIDLGNSTNLSADQAATSLARLANITGLPQTQFSNLGSTIVALGNNFATTEAEITQMGLRLAGAGKQIGFTEAQTLGFATALSSVGIEAEAGGTAFSTVFKRIQLAVESGGKDLTNFAKVSGQTSESFKKSFQTNAAGAIVSFVEGLGKIKEQGGSTLQTLAGLDLADIRVSDSLLRLSGAGDLARRSVELGTKAFADNTALAKEAGQRYETTASQIQVAKNRLNDLGITIGNAVLPVVKSATSFIGKLADGFAGLDPSTQRLILAVGGVAAAIGPLLVVGGSLIALIPAVAGGLTFLGVSAGAVLGPVAAIAAAGYLLISNWDDIVQYFSGGEGSRVFSELASSVTDAVGTIGGALSDLASLGGGNFGNLLSAAGLVRAAFESISVGITAVSDVVSGVIKTITSLFQGEWQAAFDGAKQAVVGLIAPLTSVLGLDTTNLREMVGLVSRLNGDKFTAKSFTAPLSGLDGYIQTTYDAISGTKQFTSLVGNQLTQAQLDAEAAAKKHATTLGELKQQLKAAQDLLDTQVGGTKEFAATQAEIKRLDDLIKKLTGTAKGSASEIAKAFASLRKELAGVDVQVKLGLETNGAQAKIDVLEKGLKKLTDLGVGFSSKSLQGLNTQLLKLQQSLDVGFVPVDVNVIPQVKIPTTLGDKLGKDVAAIIGPALASQPLTLPITIPNFGPTYAEQGNIILDANLSVADSMRKINDVALSVGSGFQSGFNVASEQANVLKGAIQSLTSQGISVLSPAVQALNQQLQEALQAARIEDFVKSLQNDIIPAMAGVADVLGSSIGGALFQGADFLKTALGGIIKVLAQFMAEYGKKLLLIGAADIAIGNVGKGALEIAAGGALIIGAGIASAGGSALSSSGGSRSGGTSAGGGAVASVPQPGVYTSSYKPEEQAGSYNNTTTIVLTLDGKVVAENTTMYQDRYGRVTGRKYGN
ncbi:phage tail tape measure protein [Hymenobacter sp. BT491]|uniref:phage tail tape measure protein n=1 Tax=Hymenobacter sp. BT491 TaxID=2766779 RepID=UPI001653ECA0|nr:phage tail tape measure protein [Hymenobacter sp. BT491]MBC6988931.1 phage tail tape measure protein [Hymenobacter sp. BT491]